MINIKDIFRVKFGGGADNTALVVAKGDETRNVKDGEVKTSFLPGEPIFFYVHHEEAVRIKTVKASAGTIAYLGDEPQPREEKLEFEDLDEKAMLDEIPEGSVSLAWKGNVGLGKTIKGREITIKKPFPAVAMVSYKSRCHIYRLQTPSMTLTGKQTFPLLVVVYMEAS